MVLNKKGNIFKLWFFVVLFNVFLALGFTLLVGFNNLATTEIVAPIHDAVSDIAVDRTSVEIQNHIDKAFTDYQENALPWDLIIFGLAINFYFFIIYSAIQTKKENPFIVFSMLTFGSIFLLLLISISMDVQAWILNEIYTPVFEDMAVDTPIMDWTFQNMGMIAFILAISIVLINQFDKLKDLILRRDEE